jgi:diguanylate cyclase (GGDEF)-like protein
MSIPLVGLLHVLGSLGVGFAVFYLVPIAATAWYGNRSLGLAAAVCASGSSAIAQRFIDVQGEAPTIFVWNGAAEFAVFAAVAYLVAELRKARTRIDALARTDGLTGMVNLQGFISIAGNEVERAQRYGRSLTIAYMDLDGLKKVNDARGRAEGDHLLKAVADSLRSGMRTSDTVARVGGDEFALLLPETPPASAEDVLARFRLGVRECAKKRGLSVTASIGSATFKIPPEDVEDMIRKAEELTRSAKEAGGNTVRHTAFEGNRLAKSAALSAKGHGAGPSKDELDEARAGLKRLVEAEKPDAASPVSGPEGASEDPPA